MFSIYISKKKLELEIDKRALDSCEDIMAELSAEIHDNLIQQLTILRLSLDRLERNLSNLPESERLLTSIKNEFNQVTLAIRKTSRLLAPIDTLGSSFRDSILVLCQNLERPGIGNIHFSSIGEEKKLLSRTEIYLYRITQELVHNAFKHSAAWHIWVRMFWSSSHLIIEVEDDGSGFSKINDFINILEGRKNTLKMRSRSLDARIEYLQGSNGLLARITCPIHNS